MAKARVNSRGYTREQALIQENRMLKRTVSHLRKALARLDVDRIDIAKEVIMEHYREETQADKQGDKDRVLEELKKTWLCNKCNEGYLEIKLYTKIGETWYFRKCNVCPNRTLSKQYNEKTVKGIIHEV